MNQPKPITNRYELLDKIQSVGCHVIDKERFSDHKHEFQIGEYKVQMETNDVQYHDIYVAPPSPIKSLEEMNEYVRSLLNLPSIPFGRDTFPSRLTVNKSRFRTSIHAQDGQFCLNDIIVREKKEVPYRLEIGSRSIQDLFEQDMYTHCYVYPQKDIMAEKVEEIIGDRFRRTRDILEIEYIKKFIPDFQIPTDISEEVARINKIREEVRSENGEAR